MLYYGYFRSVDTSQDSLGQRYKVEIFTDFDTASNPYPFLPNLYDLDQPIPSSGIELTMCDAPFTVSYSGNTDNIYKGYKCSTATARFMMESFNDDFFTSSSNNVLVVLLKERHDVNVQSNRITNGDGEIATKVSIQTSESDFWYGFRPQDEDRVRYTVEWIGFATPNAYNQNYTLINQPFELECQDALSTLQYWENQPDLSAFSDVSLFIDVARFIFTLIKQLGVYRDIYISNTIKVPDREMVSSLRRIILNPKNFYDKKDNKWTNHLEILNSIMGFLNLTIVPYGNNLYILQYDGIAADCQYYYHYRISANNIYTTYNPSGASFVSKGLSLLQSNVELDKDSFASNDSNISIPVVYSKIEYSTNENIVDMLDDINESKKLSNIVQVLTETEAFSSVSYSLDNNHTGHTAKWYARNQGGYIASMDTETIKTYHYGADGFANNRITQQTVEIPYSDNTIFNGTFWDYNVGSCILNNVKSDGKIFRMTNNGGWEVLDAESYSNTLDGILCYGKTTRSDINNYNDFWLVNYYNQVVLELKNDFVGKYNDYVVLSGGATFYRGLLPVSFDVDNENMKVHSNLNYLKCIISITDSSGITRYLNSTKRSKYWTSNSWSTSLCYSRLWFSEDYDEDRPFGQQFKFENTNENCEGIIIPLPEPNSTGSDDIYNITIKIIRPVGVARYNNLYSVACNSTLLQDLKLKTVSSKFASTHTHDFNSTRWTAKSDRIIDECSLNSNLSSAYLNNSDSYVNYVYYNPYSNNFYSYYPITSLTNNATSISASPENGIVSNIYNQYSTPHIMLNTTLFYSLNILPYTHIKWTSQFPNKDFVVDTMNMDFEMNRNSVVLIDKTVSSNVPEITQDIYAKDESFSDSNVLSPYYSNPYLDYFNYQYGMNRISPWNIYSSITFQNQLVDAVDKKTEANIFFEPSWINGCEGLVHIPTRTDETLDVEINSDGELIITTQN